MNMEFLKTPKSYTNHLISLGYCEDDADDIYYSLMELPGVSDKYAEEVRCRLLQIRKEPYEMPYDTPSLDTSFHDHEMDV
jgi:hypothetical protein